MARQATGAKEWMEKKATLNQIGRTIRNKWGHFLKLMQTANKNVLCSEFYDATNKSDKDSPKITVQKENNRKFAWDILRVKRSENISLFKAFERRLSSSEWVWFGSLGIHAVRFGFYYEWNHSNEFNVRESFWQVKN